MDKLNAWLYKYSDAFSGTCWRRCLLMNDFKLDCTTEIKTHDSLLAESLLGHRDNKTESSFGWIASVDIVTGVPDTLWVFNIIKWKESK